jgi:hypothetical protein
VWEVAEEAVAVATALALTVAEEAGLVVWG